MKRPIMESTNLRTYQAPECACFEIQPRGCFADVLSGEETLDDMGSVVIYYEL